MPVTLAIMQPYFMPYAGYFRLFAACDLFVIYDCVQFPRRGWVHRNQLKTHHSQSQWLTLPLQKSSRDIKISALTFAEDAKIRWHEQIKQFPALYKAYKNGDSLAQTVACLEGTPVDYLENTLLKVNSFLDIPGRVVRSSLLDLPETLRGQDRILAILQHYKAKHYINAPGGRALYQEQDFKNQGVTLSFLSDYQGPKLSILERILTEDRQALKTEILQQI